jgi:hypothetical protein
MKKTLPNFLIVGAAKCGTTSLHHYLKQHPEILMPRKKKETFFFVTPKSLLGKGPGYFGKNLINNLEHYKNLYADACNKEYKAIGEACVAYLFFHETSIENIKKVLDNPKIIIILRNPINRAFSNYLHHARDGLEDLSFADAIKNQKNRKDKNWWWGYQLTELGFYYKSIKSYIKHFNETKIYLFDDLRKDPLILMQDIFNFLEVDPTFAPDTKKKHNVSGIPKNKFINTLLKKPNVFKNALKPIANLFLSERQKQQMINKINIQNLYKPEMKPETREYLKNLYREDVLKLQELLKRDLSHWLQ